MNDYEQGVVIGAGNSDATKVRVYRSTLSDEAIEALGVNRGSKNFTSTPHETYWPEKPSKDFVRGFFSCKRRMNIVPGVFSERALAPLVSKEQVVGLTKLYLDLGIKQFSVWPVVNTKGMETLPYRIVIDDDDSLRRLLDWLGNDVESFYWQQAL